MRLQPNKNQLDVFQVHDKENNSESEIHLSYNRKDFSKQCEKLFYILINGEQITTKSALLIHNIHSLPRRIMDLRNDNGVKISDKWDSTEKVKIWYMSQEDKDFNEKFCELKN